MSVTEETINGLTFNKTDATKSWRLVYNDGESWALLFESDGCTQSKSTIEIMEDEQTGIDRIKELGLKRHGEDN